MGIYSSQAYLGSTVKVNIEKLLEWLKINQPEHPLVEEYEMSRRYSREVDVKLYSINKEKIDSFYDLLNDGSELAPSNIRRCKQYMNLIKSFKTKLPKTLSDLATTLNLYLKDKSVSFTLKSTNHSLWLVRARQISFTPYDAQSGTESHTELLAQYVKFEQKQTLSITFRQDDLTSGKTVEELLALKGWTLATEEDIEEYKDKYNRYLEAITSVGKQFLTLSSVKTYLRSSRNRWDSSYVTVPINSKVVVDTPTDFKLPHLTDSVEYFFQGEADKTKFIYRSYNACILSVFSLQLKADIDISIDHIKPYVYNDSLVDSLILPQSHKNCLDILMHYDSTDFADIIEGKSAGIVVLASGDPGLGKSLSAEVCAELTHKPLYQVSSSELGISSETIETELKTVLERASRWKAVLLLDEADTFIRRRGNDLQQNAIVGTILRVLEYFDGILFMTTNRFLDTDGKVFIDDAILSRATAHLRYDYPTREEAEAILKVQCTELNVTIDDIEVSNIISFLMGGHKISGRDIRNCVKLAKMFMTKDGGEKLHLGYITEVLPFHATIGTVHND